jgi:phenylalanyl-tRNA synthetase alpha chain
MSLLEEAARLAQTCSIEAQDLEREPTPETVEAFKVRWLGRKGHWTLLMDQLRNLPKDIRPEAGKALNHHKKEAEALFLRLGDSLKKAKIRACLEIPSVDLSLPCPTQRGGSHPIVWMRHKLLELFRSYGFTIFDGPEADFDFYNFSALNIPEHHPARDMQDTFFIEGTPQVLRTHTSNIQIHAMLETPPPLRLIAPGRVYRVDNDATHSPMFHQIECVLVDRGIHMGHMKGMIDAFMKALFGSKIKTRLRPSYFPFVEPGAEMDLSCTLCSGAGCRVCKNTGWLEIGGCGMIHPNVFESVGYDSEEFTGFAFGFGIDRMAMLAWAIPDLRQMFEGDGGFSQAFPVWNFSEREHTR